MIAYNGVHLLASLTVGLGAAWLVHEAEDHHALWYVVFFAFLAGFIYAVGAMGVFAAEIAGVMSWSAVVTGTAIGGLTIIAYLWATHPGLGRALGTERED